MSTTSTSAPACRASTLTAAPPARKFAIIEAVTSCGHGVTPCACTPWSPAKTATTGRASAAGGQVRWIPQSRTDASSRTPSDAGRLGQLGLAVAGVGHRRLVERLDRGQHVGQAGVGHARPLSPSGRAPPHRTGGRTGRAMFGDVPTVPVAKENR